MMMLKKVTALLLLVSLCSLGSFAVTSSTTASLLPVADWGHTAQTIIHYIGRAIEIIQKYTSNLNEYRSLVNEARMLANDAQSLKSLETHFSRDGYQGLLEFQNTYNSLSRFAHTNGNLIKPYWEIFRAYGIPVTDGEHEESLALNEGLRALRGTAQALSDFHRIRRDQKIQLEGMRDQIRNADGHEKILEVASSILLYTAEAADYQASISAAAADATLVAESERINRDARSLTAFHQWVDPVVAATPTPITDSGYGPNPNGAFLRGPG